MQHTNVAQALRAENGPVVKRFAGRGLVAQLWKSHHAASREGPSKRFSRREDPTDLFDVLSKLPLEHSAGEMLAWYRSGDLWRVAMAAHYFAHSGYRHLIEDLIGQLRSGEKDIVEKAAKALIRLSEPAVNKVLSLLADPEICGIAVEILTRMNAHVVAFLIASLKTQPLEIRVGILASLARRRDREWRQELCLPLNDWRRERERHEVV